MMQRLYHRSGIDPLVTADTDYTISLIVTARGTGALAVDSTSATANDAVTATVQHVLPAAGAPVIEINTISTGDEGAAVQLSVSISGGVYDELDYSWSVTGGTLDSNTAESPTWTRPSVDADTDQYDFSHCYGERNGYDCDRRDKCYL